MTIGNRACAACALSPAISLYLLALLSRRPLFARPPCPAADESTPGTKTNATGGPYPQEYAAFTQRFRMPRNGNPVEPNFYYTYATGPAYFVSVDGENDYAAGSVQHAWLDATLAAVDRTVHPWLFAVMHHPVLSSDSDEAPDHTPGGPRSIALEPLFLKYKVDVVFQGHQQ